MEDREARAVLEQMAEAVDEFSTAPSFAEMPRRALEDKLAAGPTSAHVIEEVHTPLNVAYVTFTTGSTAFQNIVGVTHEELPERVAAGVAALERVGAQAGEDLLVCYPPLVNVFSRQVFDDTAVRPRFLSHSSRDAFLVALCRDRPRLVIGESSFLRAALEDAKRLGLWDLVPRGLVLFASGTPLDLELLETARALDASVHDLYGCQEFGWIAMDGEPLRDDLSLLPEGEGRLALAVGGLPTGDSFPASGRHVLGGEGSLPTYARQRTRCEHDVVVKASTARSAMTVERAARSILRIKGRVVRVDPELETGAVANVLELRPATGFEGSSHLIDDPRKTVLFARLLEAQERFQSQSKSDPVWMKRR